MVESEKAQKEEAYVPATHQLMIETMMEWLLSRSGSMLVLRYGCMIKLLDRLL